MLNSTKKTLACTGLALLLSCNIANAATATADYTGFIVKMESADFAKKQELALSEHRTKALSAHNLMDTATSSQKVMGLSASDMTTVKKVHTFSNYVVIQSDDQSLANKLKVGQGVIGVYKDFKISNHVADTWHLNKAGNVSPYFPASIGAVDANNLGYNYKKTTVAIVDSGYTNIPALHGKVVSEYDFLDLDTSAIDPGNSDGTCSSSWHGTLVSGIISTNTGSMSAVSGNTDFMHARVLDSCGNGSLSALIESILWASNTNDTTPNSYAKPADVINLSLGSNSSQYEACIQPLQDAITKAISAGSVVVASAGNNSQNFLPMPANCQGVVSVGATDENKYLTSYSNSSTALSILAPGGTTTKPLMTLGIQGSGQQYNIVESTASLGTSFSAPLVSGSVAFLKSMFNDLSSQSAMSLLAATASYSNCDTAHCGEAKSLNLLDAVNAKIAGYGISYDAYQTNSQGVKSADTLQAKQTAYLTMDFKTSSASTVYYAWSVDSNPSNIPVGLMSTANNAYFIVPDQKTAYPTTFDLLIRAVATVDGVSYTKTIPIHIQGDSAPTLTATTKTATVQINTSNTGTIDLKSVLTVSDENVATTLFVLSSNAPSGVSLNGSVLTIAQPSSKVTNLMVPIYAVDENGNYSSVVQLPVQLVYSSSQGVLDTNQDASSGGGGSVDVIALVGLMIAVLSLMTLRKKS